MSVGFHFDISSYLSVDSFKFNFTGIYNSDNPAFQSLGFSYGNNFSTGAGISAPLGQTVSGSRITSSSYISGNILSVYVLTALASGSGSFTQINSLEVYGEIEGVLAPTVAPVPEPMSFVVWGGIAIIGGIFAYKRRVA